jgi:hypothetical protein
MTRSKTDPAQKFSSSTPTALLIGADLSLKKGYYLKTMYLSKKKISSYNKIDKYYLIDILYQ